MIRLLSYNIHKGIGGDRRYRLQRTLEVIAAEDPDLVCLQEVDQNVRRSHHDDQPALLAERFGRGGWLFQLNVPHRRGGGYGNLLLSRWPLARQDQVSLRLHRRKPRGAQLAVVETPRGPLHLVHWHLGLAEKERRWQVRHLLGREEFLTADGLPTVVVGDFNDWRDRLALHCFADHGFTQATDPSRQFRSFPALWPMLALDKCFHRGGVRVREARVVRSRLTRVASDHLPLVVDLDVHVHPHAHPPGA